MVCLLSFWSIGVSPSPPDRATTTGRADYGDPRMRRATLGKPKSLARRDARTASAVALPTHRHAGRNDQQWRLAADGANDRRALREVTR